MFGVVMLSLYGPALVQTRAWPLDLRQEVLVLVAGSILPLAILAFRFPLIAGIAQFSTAFIGNQLLHEAPLARLRDLSTVSMGLALAMLFIAVFRGILEITQEAFGESEEAEEEDSVRAA